MIKINKSKKQQNHQLNIVILKNFAYYKMFCKLFFFFFRNSSQGNFLYCPRFFILKLLILLVLLLKWNKTCHIDFFIIKIFVVLSLNIILDEYSIFLSHLKWVFFNDREWTEKTILLLSNMNINKLFCVTANIQLPKCRFEKWLRLC